MVSAGHCEELGLSGTLVLKELKVGVVGWCCWWLGVTTG